ncbi:MAG: cytochrome c oxidase assembly protein [Solirubrobacteraceae bacterium]
MPQAVLPLALISLFGALYALGERRTARLLRRPRSSRDRLHSLYFYAGLVASAVAVVGPIDTYAEKLFWVHMVQHVLLLGVAAPLIVLGAPWMSIWRPLPLGFRRSVAGTIAHSPWCAPLRALKVLGRPVGAWLAYSVDLVTWHIPAAYDLAARQRAVHDLEHLSFMVFGILLWAQVLQSPPLRLRLRDIHRVYYIVGASIVGWMISLVLVFSSTPLYPFYAHIANRPGGISAIADQQLAGGIMLVGGSLSMTIFVFAQIYAWLGDEPGERPRQPPARSPDPQPSADGPPGATRALAHAGADRD